MFTSGSKISKSAFSFFTLSRKSVLSYEAIIKRNFRNFIQPSENHPQVVLASNSALPVIASIIKYHQNSTSNQMIKRDLQPLLPNITALFIQNYWLDPIHSDHYKNDWGQDPSGLLDILRDFFKELFPHHPQNKKITFEQIDHLRQHSINFIKEYYPNIPIITGDIQPIRKEGQKWRLDIKEGDKTHTFYFDENIHVINTLSIPRDFSQVTANFNIKNSQIIPHDKMYQLSKENFPSTFVFGSGLSAQWLRRDFAGLPVLILAQGELPKNPDTEKIKSDVEVWYLDEIEIKENPQQENTFIVTNTKTGKSFTGQAAQAIGYEPAINLTQAMSPLDLDDPKPKQEGSYEILDIKRLGEYVSTGDTPVGSAIHRSIGWRIQTNQGHTITEISSFYTPHFKDEGHFKKHMAEVGIFINDDFDNELKNLVKGKYFSMGYNEKKEVFLQAYDKTHPTLHQRMQFEKRLDELPTLQLSKKYEINENTEGPTP